MRRMLRVLFTIATATFLSFNVAGQVRQETKPAPDSSNASKDQSTTTREFPIVKGWSRGEVSPIPNEIDGSVAGYQFSGATATLFVYSRPGKIENKLDGSVKEEFDVAIEAIQIVANTGLYEDLKKLRKDEVKVAGKLGKIKSLHALLSFRLRGEAKLTELFVFPYKGKIVKLRVTRPEGFDTSQANYLQIFSSIDQFFSK